MIFWNCSTKKNTFISRTVHTTATKYNVLYNGKMAFEKAKKQLDDAYKDDFTKLLPIEPLKIEEEKTLTLPEIPNSKTKATSKSINQNVQNKNLKGNPKRNSREKTNKNINKGEETTSKSTATGFDRAEEKAVKAVQKHSINIGTKEKNKQIDDAYFLLGQARYYDQRFVPALETFKYMIKKYPKSNLFEQARIWEAKTLIRLGQEEDAIYKLEKYLLKQKDIPKNIQDAAHTALAMAYLKQDSIQQTINHLNQALAVTKKNFNQATRNTFVLGQLYRKESKIDSSNMVFDKIANDKKAPYRFQIYAKIERAKNYNKETDDTALMLENLEKLTKNRDNRPFLDGIFYQIGRIKLLNDKPNEAITYFKKTLRTKQAHNQEKDFAYEQLGNIYFDKANFVDAGAYYDSVLNITKDEKTVRIRRIFRKRKSLENVIRLEDIAKKNDSILNLVEMDSIDRISYFKEYIKKLKAKDKEAKIIAENKKRGNFNGFGNLDSKQNSNKLAKFYFYNVQTVSFGEQEFKNIWGNRALLDNWRISSASDNTNKDSDKEDVVEVKEKHTKKYEIETYLATIPNEAIKIDSITSQRNKAYYKLGVIYKEQFKKPNLAITKLESLLDFKPDSKLILPSYYHLYQAFDGINKNKRNYYKNKITNDFADSRYAQLIENPNSKEILEDSDSPENIYYKVYCQYEYEEYENVIEQCNKNINALDETPLIAKFELLKAQAIAKTKGKETYIKALTYVINNFPNTDEGKRAQEILDFLNGIKPTKKENKKEIKYANNKQKIRKKQNTTPKRPSNDEILKRIKAKKRRGKSMGPPGFGG